MAQVLVRQLDDDAVEALKVRAALNSRSLEAELREVLHHAARPSQAERVALARTVRGRVAEALGRWSGSSDSGALGHLDVEALLR